MMKPHELAQAATLRSDLEAHGLAALEKTGPFGNTLGAILLYRRLALEPERPRGLPGAVGRTDLPLRCRYLPQRREGHRVPPARSYPKPRGGRTRLERPFPRVTGSWLP